MGVKRIVDIDFWLDPFVLDNYSVEDKYFLLYLMTNPRSSQLGIYTLPKKVISFETGYTMEVVSVLIERFANKYENIIYCNKTQEITILNSLKYSIVKGGRPVSDLLEREIKKVNDSSLILKTYNHLQEFWARSSRRFDTTVRSIFERELINRNLLEHKDSTAKQNDNDNKNDNQNDNDNDNVNDNDNEESWYDSSHDSSHDSSYDSFDKFQSIRYFKEHFNKGKLSLKHRNHLSRWINTLSDEIVLEALKRSDLATNPMSYSTSILKSWHDKGVRSLEEIGKLDQRYANKQSTYHKKPKQNTHREIIPSWMTEESEDK